MTQPDPTSRRPGLWTALAVTAIAGASAVTIALPPNGGRPNPCRPPPPPPTRRPGPGRDRRRPAPPRRRRRLPRSRPAAASGCPRRACSGCRARTGPWPAGAPAAGARAGPGRSACCSGGPQCPAAALRPVDPNAAAPAAAPPAVEAGRVKNAAGGFSYVLPAGWEAADASRLSYGQALLLKQTGPAPLPGQPAPTATDTSILLGRLDMKLFAGAEQDNAKAAVRLASDMGEFFMPFAGTRINQQTAASAGR